MASRAAILALTLLALSACSFAERDQFQDKRNDLKRTVIACGSDTACIERAEKAHAPKPAKT